MKNMKIRTRLILSYFIIVVMLLVAGITAITMLDKVGDSLKSFYDKQFQTVEMTWSARANVFKVRAELMQAIVDDDAVNTRTFLNDAQADFTAMRSDIAAAKKTFEGDMSLLTNAESLLTQTEALLGEISAMAMANELEEAYRLLTDQYMPAMTQVRDALTEAGRIADANAEQKVTDGQKLANIADLVVLLMVLVAIVCSIGLGLYMSRSIVTPMREMNQLCSDMARGKLDANIAYQSTDEIGEMADSLRSLIKSVQHIIKDIDYCFTQMAKGNFAVHSKAEEYYIGEYFSILEAFRHLRDTMNDTLLQIDVAADQVNSGGEQVSSSAQALAQGATQQASSVEELAATINEINRQVESTSEYSKTAYNENMQAHNLIESCSAHMNNLMTAMQAIDNKSKEISKVIKTIEDIAFQTNILALNAAVEAARAGAAGKGFAVVADEVRNLATKSQEASKSTAILIEETVRAVDEGTRISNETESALREVVGSAQNVLNSITLISNAMDEEAQAVQQVTTGIDQISSVVQTNSATAEQSAAASEELSGQANLLKELVSHFSINRDDAMHKSSMKNAHASATGGGAGAAAGYAGMEKY